MLEGTRARTHTHTHTPTHQPPHSSPPPRAHTHTHTFAHSHASRERRDASHLTKLTEEGVKLLRLQCIAIRALGPPSLPFPCPAKISYFIFVLAAEAPLLASRADKDSWMPSSSS